MENYFNCIYCYTNKINGKKYVGQAVNFKKRHQQHISKSSNRFIIDRAIKKYGIENFEIKILKENLETRCLLNLWESYYIDKLNTLDKEKGYNMSSGGSNGNNFINKTDEEMQEIGKRISEAHKGEKHPLYGKQHSEESKAKMSENHADFKGGKHPKAKRVIQIDITTKTIIKVWNYAKEISDNLDIKYVTLKYYLQGRAKTHEYAGYLWYYEDDFNELNLDSA